MYSYIIVRIIPAINTWYWYLIIAIDYYNNSSTSIQHSICMTLCTERFTRCILGTTTAAVTTVVAVLVFSH